MTILNGASLFNGTICSRNMWIKQFTWFIFNVDRSWMKRNINDLNNIFLMIWHHSFPIDDQTKYKRWSHPFKIATHSLPQNLGIDAESPYLECFKLIEIQNINVQKITKLCTILEVVYFACSPFIFWVIRTHFPLYMSANLLGSTWNFH